MCILALIHIRQYIFIYFSRIFFSSIAFMMFSSTIYEVTCLKRSQQMKPLLKAFSTYSNCKKIFSMKVSSSNEIRSLHGIRALSIMWIVLTHTYIVSFWQVPTLNGQEVIEVRDLMFIKLLVHGRLNYVEECILDFIIVFVLF